MKRWMLVLGLVVSAVLPMPAQDKTPEIKEVMEKLHKGPSCLRASLGKALRADAPAWGAVQKETKSFAELAAALGKNAPPKGDKASWEKLTGDFATQAKAMSTAAQKKDKAAIQTAYGKLGNCKGCHNAHKP